MGVPREYGPTLDAIRGLAWPARRRVGGTLSGTHLSRMRGRAPELSEYRLYRQGDDPRQLDWKLLARSDRPFVRLSDDRAIHPTLFIVDASASMRFPAESEAKWRMARVLAVSLAAIAQRSGDPVGATVVGAAGSVRVRARTRSDVIAELATALGEVRPEGSAPLAPSLLHVSPRARVVIISDLLGDDDATRRAAAAHATGGGDVHVLHIVATDELSPPAALRLAIDPEDAAVTRPLDAAARAEYVARFAQWREETARAWRLAGVAYREVVAEDDAAVVARRVVTASPEHAA